MKPRLLRSGLTGAVYVVTRYTEKDGQIVAQTKHDVTEDACAIEREAVLAYLDSDAAREMARDAEKWRAAEAEGHVVDFSESGYGLQHPPSCRPNLIGCRYNVFLAEYGEPLMEPGRYRMTWANDDDMPVLAALKEAAK